MNGTPFTTVGRTIKTHGLSGEISVEVSAGVSPHSLIGLEAWFVPPATELRSAVVSAVRPGPKGPLFTFEGVTTIDLAKRLCGKSLLVSADAVSSVETDDADDDVEGYRVIDSVHGDLGVVEETIITGANDVWVVQGALGEVLIPVIEQVVDSIDDEDRCIHVTLLDGLLEDR